MGQVRGVPEIEDVDRKSRGREESRMERFALRVDVNHSEGLSAVCDSAQASLPLTAPTWSMGCLVIVSRAKHTE